jgi:hypothetical protein
VRSERDDGARVDVHVTASWRTARSSRAMTPSAQETSELSRIVASVEPSATVTTRSKALSLASVRLPVSRSTTTSVT